MTGAEARQQPGDPRAPRRPVARLPRPTTLRACARSPETVGSSSGSPQPTHAGLARRGISVQHVSQIGTEEKRGGGDPQNVQSQGRRVQLPASMGLRSTRAMARQREISDGGRSIVSESKSLLKTHLAREAVANTATRSQYTDPSAVVPIWFAKGISSDTEQS